MEVGAVGLNAEVPVRHVHRIPVLCYRGMPFHQCLFTLMSNVAPTSMQMLFSRDLFRLSWVWQSEAKKNGQKGLWFKVSQQEMRGLTWNEGVGKPGQAHERVKFSLCRYYTRLLGFYSKHIFRGFQGPVTKSKSDSMSLVRVILKSL